MLTHHKSSLRHQQHLQLSSNSRLSSQPETQPTNFFGPFQGHQYFPKQLLSCVINTHPSLKTNKAQYKYLQKNKTKKSPTLTLTPSVHKSISTYL